MLNFKNISPINLLWIILSDLLCIFNFVTNDTCLLIFTLPSCHKTTVFYQEVYLPYSSHLIIFPGTNNIWDAFSMKKHKLFQFVFIIKLLSIIKNSWDYLSFYLLSHLTAFCSSSDFVYFYCWVPIYFCQCEIFLILKLFLWLSSSKRTNMDTDKSANLKAISFL